MKLVALIISASVGIHGINKYLDKRDVEDKLEKMTIEKDMYRKLYLKGNTYIMEMQKEIERRCICR